MAIPMRGIFPVRKVAPHVDTGNKQSVRRPSVDRSPAAASRKLLGGRPSLGEQGVSKENNQRTPPRRHRGGGTDKSHHLHNHAKMHQMQHKKSK